MPLSNAALLRKAAGPIGTGDFTAASGLLSAEQSSAFLDRVYVSTPFTQLQRSERRRAMVGTIAKMGIGGRILRAKHAGVDDSVLIKPVFGDVAYAIARYRVDSEIEEEVFEENIEQEGFEDHWLNTVTGQVGRDLEDLHFNGDETSLDPFLSLNRGWLRQLALSSTAHRINGATITAGALSKGHFFGAYEALPDQYKAQSDQMRWLMSPTNEARWLEYLTNRATPAGDAAIFGTGATRGPLGIAIQTIPSMPNDRILLSATKNFIVVFHREIRYRKTTEGREAIREDKRFYAWFISDDPIIEEDAGIADIYGLTA
jgi:hypothetical protein